MTKRELINILENSSHNDDDLVFVYVSMNKDLEYLEEVVYKLQYIESIDLDVSGRIDINVVLNE